MNVGERIRELRLGKGMTQAQLAEASGVPLPTIRNFEQEKRDPSWPTLQRLALALGVSLSAFDGLELADARAAPRRPKRRR